MLHIDARRAAAPLALLFDQPSALQFTQQLTGLLLAAAQVSLYGCDREKDIDAAMLVQPALLHGKVHTVQQKPVQQLGVSRDRTILRVCDQGLGDAIEGVFNGVSFCEIVVQVVISFVIVIMCRRSRSRSCPGFSPQRIGPLVHSYHRVLRLDHIPSDGYLVFKVQKLSTISGQTDTVCEPAA